MNYLSRDVSVLDLTDTSRRPVAATIAAAPETLAPELLRGKVLFNKANDPRLSGEARSRLQRLRGALPTITRAETVSARDAKPPAHSLLAATVATGGRNNHVRARENPLDPPDHGTPKENP